MTGPRTGRGELAVRALNKARRAAAAKITAQLDRRVAKGKVQ
jgi:hypothetical protein